MRSVDVILNSNVIRYSEGTRERQNVNKTFLTVGFFPKSSLSNLKSLEILKIFKA